jgi:predicted Fe-Mo cluster-binding NifX family protein
MNIVITSQGKELDSMVDPRFGRAKYFIVYDLNTGEYAAIDNVQNLNAAQGAGIQAGQNVIGTGAEVLITGNCGPKAFRILSAGDLKVFKSSDGSVSENIEKYKNSELEEMKDANVEGHWV